jgi:bacteriorhodopsin
LRFRWWWKASCRIGIFDYLSKVWNLKRRNMVPSKKSSNKDNLLILILIPFAAGLAYLVYTAFFGSTPLTKAAEHGNFAEVKRLVEAGEPMDKRICWGGRLLKPLCIFMDFNAQEISVA